jgi:NAD(P)-dependent dehydrogenase (short-subunit alcohol dehydrogenase family)
VVGIGIAILSLATAFLCMIFDHKIATMPRDRHVVTNPYYSASAFTLISSCALGYGVISQFCFRNYWKAVKKQNDNVLAAAGDESTSKRVVIITGSNTGIGFAAARELILRYQCEVIFACRSEKSAVEAIQQIESERSKGQNGRGVFIAPLDLSSFASVRSFVEQLQRVCAGRKIDILVNNAGRNTGGPSPHDSVIRLLSSETDDESTPIVDRQSQHEEPLCVMFQTNFLGHFLLTSELLRTGLLADSPGTRIINLSSVMHHVVASDASPIEQLQSFEFWYNGVAPSAAKPRSTYSLSKLAAILFTMELRRRYPNIQSIAVNPGTV